MLAPIVESGRRDPWNKGKLVGQKAPLKLREIWAIRVRLEPGDRKRELALFNLAIDSKLRGCDLVQLRVRDVAHGDRIAARTIIMQQKTQRSRRRIRSAAYRVRRQQRHAGRHYLMDEPLLSSSSSSCRFRCGQGGYVDQGLPHELDEALELLTNSAHRHSRGDSHV
jgi:hypothetical protein